VIATARFAVVVTTSCSPAARPIANAAEHHHVAITLIEPTKGPEFCEPRGAAAPTEHAHCCGS
jgi:hypothetical protein